MFSIKSPHQSGSNEYTQHTIINLKKKITLKYPKFNTVCSYGIFSLGTQERVRNSRGKRGIGVRAIEVPLYFPKHLAFLTFSATVVKCCLAAVRSSHTSS